ncbi:MAG: hypothetical protein ACQERN_09505 [Thermodesulfobacteriota bacterium]
MDNAGCKKCALRAKYDKNPKSFLGRLWRWHINWCPGWKKHVASLCEDEKNRVAEKYRLKLK